MKAVMLTGAGGTDMLKLMEVPDPALKILKMYWCACMHAD